MSNMTSRQSLLRTIARATIERIEKQYGESEAAELVFDGNSSLEEKKLYRQKKALQARRHMMPHAGDGLLRSEDFDSGTNKIVVHILLESLPVIWRGTPYGHIDGLKKCVTFVAIATKNLRPRFEDPTARLPALAYREGEVFWVAGLSENLRSFVAKSQDRLAEAGDDAKWEESKWGLVTRDDCQLAVLDIKDGAWILCDSKRS